MEIKAKFEERYLRQFGLPEIGEAGQGRLTGASVLIAGLGGLGSSASYYLAAAGVGQLKIVDKDIVDLSNLNRQILHSVDNVGRRKTVSAEATLRALNPDCGIVATYAEINDITIDGLVEKCDVILDATDNLATRKLLNRASLKNSIPLVFGGVDGFNGMISTFVPGDTGCLECLFPKDQSPVSPPSVLGPLPGIIGSLQALEVLKLILGAGESLKNRLLRIDGRKMIFKTTEFDRNPQCMACAGNP
jgi:molybdopterin-synthase adenylyltransferase